MKHMVQDKKPGVPWFTPGFNMKMIDFKEDIKLNMPYATVGDWQYVARATYKYKLCDKFIDTRYRLFTLTKQLNNTHFPDVASLVNHLNDTCRDILNDNASTLNIAVPGDDDDDKGPFTCKKNVVSFTQYKHFDVKCSPFLAKMLHLTLTSEGVLNTQ